MQRTGRRLFHGFDPSACVGGSSAPPEIAAFPSAEDTSRGHETPQFVAKTIDRSTRAGLFHEIGATIQRYRPAVAALIAGVLIGGSGLALAAAPAPESRLDETVAIQEVSPARSPRPSADLYAQAAQVIFGGQAAGLDPMAAPPGAVVVSPGGRYLDWLIVEGDQLAKTYADALSQDRARVRRLAELGYEGVTVRSPAGSWMISLEPLRKAGVTTDPRYAVDRKHSSQAGALFNALAAKIGYWTGTPEERQAFEDRALRAFELKRRGDRLEVMDFWHVNDGRYDAALRADGQVAEVLRRAGIRRLSIDDSYHFQL